MTEDLKSAEIIRDLTAAAAAQISDFPANPTSVKLVRSSTGAVSTSYTALDLEKYLLAPVRNRETLEFQDSESFLRYIEDFKNPNSRIFFDKDTNQFTAVVDFPSKDDQAWGDHIASLKLSLSEEWKLWFERAGKPVGQVAFGRFIEENMIDVIEPDGASLLEMVMTFEATKNITMREATRLKDNRVQFSWVEDIKTGTIEIPESITISIAVFYGQKPRPIQLRFRYTIDDQKLKLHYEFVRPERIKNDAAAEIVAVVRADTNLPVHVGKRTTKRQ